MNQPTPAPVHKAGPEPTHATPMGVHLWLTGDGRVLMWSGAHDLVRVATVIIDRGGTAPLAVGAPVAVISGRCETLTDASLAAGLWLDGNVSTPRDDEKGDPADG